MVAPWFNDEAAMSPYGAQCVAQGSAKGRPHSQKKHVFLLALAPLALALWRWPPWRWPLALALWRWPPGADPLALAPGTGHPRAPNTLGVPRWAPSLGSPVRRNPPGKFKKRGAL